MQSIAEVKQRSSLRFLAIVATLAALTLTWIVAAWNSLRASSGSAAASPAAAEVIHGAARYIEYPTIRELVRASSTVVRARAVRRLSSYADPVDVPAGAPAEKATAAAIGVIRTDIVFRVLQRYTGARAARQIRVVHLGGTVRGQRLVVEGEPLSAAGRQYILFLRRGSDGRFRIVGGGQGRYPVVAGRLQLISSDVAEAPVPKALRGMRLSRFRRLFGRTPLSPNFDAPTAQRLTGTEPLNQPPPTKPEAPQGPPPPP